MECDVFIQLPYYGLLTTILKYQELFVKNGIAHVFSCIIIYIEVIWVYDKCAKMI